MKEHDIVGHHRGRSKLNKAFLIWGLLASVLLTACSVAAAPAVALPVQRLPLSANQQVFIEIDHGSLDISNASSGAVEISGQAPAGEGKSLQLRIAADGIHITFKAPARPFWQQGGAILRLSVRVPNGALVSINTFDAGIVIHDFTGNVSVTAVSGEITIDDSKGSFDVKSNRGNVTAQASSGKVHFAGNYGVLSMVNTHGESSAATIMGTVRFAGLISAGDQVALETDHGPVEIQLAQASNVTVQVGTTTGVVTCTMPGLQYRGQACGGTLQAGQGQLKVRTVSGGVTLGQLP